MQLLQDSSITSFMTGEWEHQQEVRQASDKLNYYAGKCNEVKLHRKNQQVVFHSLSSAEYGQDIFNKMIFIRIQINFL